MGGFCLKIVITGTMSISLRYSSKLKKALREHLSSPTRASILSTKLARRRARLENVIRLLFSMLINRHLRQLLLMAMPSVRQEETSKRNWQLIAHTVKRFLCSHHNGVRQTEEKWRHQKIMRASMKLKRFPAGVSFIFLTIMSIVLLGYFRAPCRIGNTVKLIITHEISNDIITEEDKACELHK